MSLKRRELQSEGGTWGFSFTWSGGDVQTLDPGGQDPFSSGQRYLAGNQATLAFGRGENRMNPRICVCCGEPMVEPGNALSRNPNVCASCSSLADGMEELTVPVDDLAPLETPAAELESARTRS